MYRQVWKILLIALFSVCPVFAQQPNQLDDVRINIAPGLVESGALQNSGLNFLIVRDRVKSNVLISSNDPSICPPCQLGRFIFGLMQKPKFNPNRKYHYLGSGMIADNDYVITVLHVVHSKDVRVNNLPAEIIATDPDHDLALLHVKGLEAPNAPPFNFSNCKRSEWVFAISNPGQEIIDEHSPKHQKKTKIFLNTLSIGRMLNEFYDIPIEKNTMKDTWLWESDLYADHGSSGGAVWAADGNLAGLIDAVSKDVGHKAYVIPSEYVFAFFQQNTKKIKTSKTN